MGDWIDGRWVGTGWPTTPCPPPAEPRSDTSGPEAVDAVPEQASRIEPARDLVDVALELREAFEEWEAADERFMKALRAFEQDPTLQAITAMFGSIEIACFDRKRPTLQSLIGEALRLAREQEGETA